MARPSIKVPLVPSKLPDVGGVFFSLLVGLALGIVVLLTSGSDEADSGSGCRVEVVVESLPIRSGPNPGDPVLETAGRGDIRGAETTLRNGYRQLATDRWALAESLRPVPGSAC